MNQSFNSPTNCIAGRTPVFRALRWAAWSKIFRRISTKRHHKQIKWFSWTKAWRCSTFYSFIISLIQLSHDLWTTQSCIAGCILHVWRRLDSSDKHDHDDSKINHDIIMSISRASVYDVIHEVDVDGHGVQTSCSWPRAVEMHNKIWRISGFWIIIQIHLKTKLYHSSCGL